MNEDPTTPNYDASTTYRFAAHRQHRPTIWRSPARLAVRLVEGNGHLWIASEDLPGITKIEDLKDPEKAQQMGRAMAERMDRGDVPTNLGAVSLMANAYLLTGDRKYADWVTHYVDCGWSAPARTAASRPITWD